MKKAEILAALKKVSPGLDPKGVIEQSASFVFINGYVVTYNDEISISTPLDIGGITGAIQAKEFLTLLNKWKGDELELSEKKGELLLKSKKFKAGIPIESEIELPVDFLKKKMVFEDLPDNFLEGIQTCLFSTAHENVSAIMNCVFISGSTIFSSDDFRITKYRMRDEIDENLLIPAKVARQLIKFNVTGYYGDDEWKHFEEDGTDTLFSCRTIEEEYPDLDSYLDVEGDTLILPDELSEALERSQTFSQTEESDLITISMKKGKCKIRGENAHGWTEERMKIKTKADADFQISPGILRDIMRITKEGVIGEQTIKFETETFEHAICRIAPEE